MKVWVVEALRFGDREKHSYIVGVYNCLPIAKYAAQIEEAWRGGNKYFCEIIETEVFDKPNKEKLDWFKKTSSRINLDT